MNKDYFKDVNFVIGQVAKSTGNCTFLKTYSPFLKKDPPISELYFDGIHLSEAGTHRFKSFLNSQLGIHM